MKKSRKSPDSAHKTRTKWGQNFLRDKKILKKIADFAEIKKTDTVVEVGPGEGSLTRFLLERADKVVAIEKDEKLAKELEKNFKHQIKNDKLRIICGDILEIDLQNIFSPKKISVNEPCERDWREREEFSSKKISVRENRSFFSAKKYMLVGNIPYYITGALFKKALQSKNPPCSITFVVQKEVAERIMAKDGKESILSLSIKVYGEPEYGGIIKAGSFSPAPKVDSAIIAIRNINKELLTIRGLDEVRFFDVVKAGFAHKRKLLINNLAKFSKNKVFEAFKKCGVSEKIRAEDLKIADWLCLAKELI